MKKRTFTKLFTVALLLAGSFTLQAQSYTYSMLTDTYTELVSPTIVTSNIIGTAYLTSISGTPFSLYGETFMFNGVAGLAIGENGFISATNNQGTKAFAFDGLLYGMANHSTLNTEISYVVDPSTSGPILKVQYKNMGISTGSASDFVNFQIWIYQGTGDIEYRYGSSSTSSTTFGTQTGPSIGIFLADASFSQVYETQFLVGSASNPTVDHVNTFATITGMPVDGTVYRFSANFSIGEEENKLTNTSISLFPNPASNSLTLNSTSKINHVEIIDMLGKTVLNTKLNDSIKTIDVTSLNKGLYLARIYTNSGISTARFIKQ